MATFCEFKLKDIDKFTYSVGGFSKEDKTCKHILLICPPHHKVGKHSRSSVSIEQLSDLCYVSAGSRVVVMLRK